MLATVVATTVSRLGAGPVMSSQLSPEPQRLPGNRAYQATHALGPRPLSEKECMAQLNRLPYAVVAQSEGFIWCATAKAGTTTILELLNRKFNGPRPGSNRFNAKDNYAGQRLTGNAKAQCVRAETMNTSAKRRFCAQGNALSFSVMRSPWERVLSCYVEKVALPGNWTIMTDRIADDLGLAADATISFAQFVLWLSRQQPGEDDNVHVMPWSTRCGTVDPSNYSMTARTETLQDDLRRLLDALHWDKALIQDQIDENNSVDKCKVSPTCVGAIEGQLGHGALDNVTFSRELLQVMYASDSAHDLVELVRTRYAEDVALGGFEFPR